MQLLLYFRVFDEQMMHGSNYKIDPRILARIGYNYKCAFTYRWLID